MVIRLVKQKTRKLLYQVRFYFFLVFLLVCLLLLNSSHLNQKHREEDQIKANYYSIQILLNELNSTVKTLDSLIGLYDSTRDQRYLDEYNEILEVFKGERERNSNDYLINREETISYENLIKQYLKSYNENFMVNINEIISDFKGLLLNHVNIVSNKGQIVSYMSSRQLDGEYRYDNKFNNTLVLQIDNDIKYLVNKIDYYQSIQLNSLRKEILLLDWINVILVCLISLVIFRVFFKFYYVMIKPISKNYLLIDQINQGNKDLRLTYHHDNELNSLINSVNKYLDISQSSMDLIQEQYNKLKIYSNIGEINYFELNIKNQTIELDYSSNFKRKYHLIDSNVVYTFEDYSKMIHHDDIIQVRDILFNPSQKQQHFQLEFRIRPTSQSPIAYLSMVGECQADSNSIIGVQIDITKLRSTENLLKDSEKQFQIIVDNTSELIAKFDVDGKILYASQSYCKMFDESQQHITNKTLFELNSRTKLNNNEWFYSLLEYPYKNVQVIPFHSPNGVRWIKWSNTAVLNEIGEIEYIIAIGHDITDIKQANEQLEYDSTHDPLTGLLNRRGLFHAIDRLNPNNKHVAFFIDVDNFKQINDFYGHEFGDLIIKQIAKQLEYFKDHDCVISRLSGDEFIVLFPNFDSYYKLYNIRKYLENHLSQYFEINQMKIYISSSIGFAIYPDDSADLKQLITNADIAMYESKLSKSNESVRFNQTMFESVNHKVNLANDLKKAIDQDEFFIVYQPIVNTKHDTIDFIEALIRWEHHTRGVIPPNEFLKIANDSGFMRAIDILVLRKSFGDLHKIRDYYQENHCKLSVNISPSMLLKTDFPSLLKNIAYEFDIPLGDLVIEVNEKTFVNNISECIIQIRKLRESGVLVALDDFGREYSSLSILNKVEFDIIKIDREFIVNLDDQVNREIIKMVMSVGQYKNKLIIFEGVETEYQVNILKEFGCYYMQGYYFYKPKPLD